MGVALDWDYLSQDREAVERCVVCGGEDHRLLTGADRYLQPAKFWLCRQCGVVFINPRLTAEAYSDFYELGVYRDLVGQFNERHGHQSPDLQVLQEYYTNMLAELCGKVGAQAAGWSLLDVGGAPGHVAKVLRERWRLSQTTVVDPAPCDDIDGQEAITEDFMAADLEPADLVICTQTIEHFTDPREALLKMRRLCKKRLIIDAVNFPVIFKKIPDTCCKIDHPWNFHYRALEVLLRETGFHPDPPIFRKDRPVVLYTATPGDAKRDKIGPAFVSEVLGHFDR